MNRRFVEPVLNGSFHCCYLSCCHRRQIRCVSGRWDFVEGFVVILWVGGMFSESMFSTRKLRSEKNVNV